MIPYGRQDITDDDVKAVEAVLRSDFLTQGPVVPLFEEEVKSACGALHAVAVNSATSALHVAMMALDVGPGDLVWTSPVTFVASANAARYCGADVDFVDIDPLTYNLCAKRLAEKLESAKSAGRLPKVVVPVHLAGQSCDMAAIGELAATYGFHVVEDASHAIGGSYRGKPVGNCDFSDICVFSFHPVKIITTAEGGMATTNDACLAERMAMLRNHGICRDPALMTHAPDGPWYYQQLELGYNYRMTDMQAALGISQMTRLEAYVNRRNELAARYNELLGGLPLQLPHVIGDARSSFHLYVVRLKEDCQKSHLEVFEALRAADIGVNLHYIPVHLQPYYRQFGFASGDFPQSEAYYASAISIPLYHGMSDAQQDEVVQVLGSILA